MWCIMFLLDFFKLNAKFLHGHPNEDEQKNLVMPDTFILKLYKRSKKKCSAIIHTNFPSIWSFLSSSFWNWNEKSYRPHLIKQFCSHYTTLCIQLMMIRPSFYFICGKANKIMEWKMFVHNLLSAYIFEITVFQYLLSSTWLLYPSRHPLLIALWIFNIKHIISSTGCPTYETELRYHLILKVCFVLSLRENVFFSSTETFERVEKCDPLTIVWKRFREVV